ncbi:nickel-dependent hydrogenase large subunit [Magnetospirillum sp. UT-4]|uniref:nickel-dependent hydrogenase large subunit n=1 Tax=Magnetospirillum sp. UT-4 TaxID=2681467 RepID=UPI001385F4A8|nr:nickel-dependent hydrogenase large subunit [Magnetospirillum sp. UT-4]CAA7626189.1 Uptake hydrogenase accessory protein HupV [Magnetospirillum sp. UT-4]
MSDSRLVVGPFNRVEGDLEVTLDVADGRVRQAHVTAPLYRGFERILRGRPPEDALVIAPRICGICSVSQSTAAARALAAIAGVTPPPAGRLVADLVLAAENAADHLTHFVLFFMPDFARACYGGRPWHQRARERFLAETGEAARRLLPARARLLHVMGLLAGKWPHTLALQPGGVARGVDAGERVRLLAVLADVRAALEAELYGDRLEAVAALDSADALAAWAEAHSGGDFALFLAIAGDLGLERLGRGPAAFLSAGSFGLWPGGTVIAGVPHPYDPALVAEDLTHAWMADAVRPDADKDGAYTWCKAPRLAGRPVEVGALARQVVAADPLALALVGAGGATVRDRVVMRLVELARLLIAMETWTRALPPGAPVCVESPLPLRGTGTGLVEAARGTLIHRLTLDGGAIADYAIIAPTTWNFSPRDASGIPGPLEQALAGTPVEPGETSPVAVQHVVRSFDPCMACTVH